MSSNAIPDSPASPLLESLRRIGVRHWLIPLAGVTLLTLAFLRTAWVSEDAFITFRSIDNLLHGYGFRWNVDERVMVFTHPLWALLLIPFIAVGREPYAASLVACGLCSLATVLVLLLRLARSPGVIVIVALSFAFSLSVVSFSSSGLENALVHFLIVVAVLLSLSPTLGTPRNAVHWSLLIGAAFLTRPDSVLLFVVPALFCCWPRNETSVRALLLNALLGLLPALCWLLFATVYYGSPLPNTAWAKLPSGFARTEMVRQGFVYLQMSAKRDLCGTVMALLGLIGGLTLGRPQRALVGSVLLHTAYVVWIGGDYMAGRFLTPGLVAGFALLALACQRHRRLVTPALATSLCMSGFMVHRHQAPIFMPASHQDSFAQDGVQDERGVHYRYSGLLGDLHAPRDASFFSYQWGLNAAQLVPVPRHPLVHVVFCTVGHFGLAAGPNIHIVDQLGLTDAFLARLPARKALPGHFVRAMPYGYLSASAFGDASLLHPALRALWEDVLLATRSKELFSTERFAAIWRINTGEGTRAAIASGYAAMLRKLDYPPFSDCEAPNGGAVYFVDAETAEWSARRAIAAASGAHAAR